MKEFADILKEHGYLNRSRLFQQLMPFRVRDILLVSSLYDSYILEEDGHLYEMILSGYHEFNLSQAPRVTRVSSGQEALKLAQEKGRFDLVITTLNLGDMQALEFARQLKESNPSLPIVLLTYENRELNELIKTYDVSCFEKVFIWQGDHRVMLSIIKFIEDRMNVENDTRIAGVQSIILIEDNVNYYSSFLPIIYTELFNHSQKLIREGINLSDKILRMRTRPKILLCSSYEEAIEYYNKYEDCILGVITDMKFPREGIADPEAGLNFAHEIRKSHFDIPVLFQTDSIEYAEKIVNLEASLIFKTSPTLLHDLQLFMAEHMSFGDFVFRLPSGKEVSRAIDLKSLEKALRTAPDESLRFHGEQNHFSNWLKARTEFWLAEKLRPRRMSDYDSLDDVREYLISSLKISRKERYLGSISDYNPESFDSTSSFSRIGGGSLGGKARGLAFANSLITNFKIENLFENVRIFVPPSVVIATDVFDDFLNNNNIRDFSINADDDTEIRNRFLGGNFSDNVVRDLKAFLERVKEPLSVRSSSLLEDSRYLPFAGIYATYMLPNNNLDPEIRLIHLLNAIKLVYASTFSKQAKNYLKATPYRLEEEKMAVIVQKLVGSVHENRFYPDFSGVVRSHNFYPTPPMKAADGIAAVGLGLGNTVIEGDEVVRFSPSYPKHLIQFSNVQDSLDYTQKDFYAIELDEDFELKNINPESYLKQFDLNTAERDGTLNYVGSTYSPENDRITDGLSRPGIRLVTFGPILKGNLFPLSKILKFMMDMGSWGMNTPVEIEFAVNITRDLKKPKEFAFLQIRPLVKSHEAEELNVDNVDPDKLICESPQVLGNGVIDDIYDIVVVDRETFDRAKSQMVADEIAKYNADFLAKGIPYLLIGVGRWGTSDSWLGIPVTWDQISGARVIVETGIKGFKVVPSQGTHFFQNITSFMVGYFTINSFFKGGNVDWEWLKKQKSVSEYTFTRHIRFKYPIMVKMNGHNHKGIVIKPEI